MMHASYNGHGPSAADYQDQILPCDACGGEFLFRGSEQAFFAEKGFSAPRRCSGARKARKTTGRSERYEACPFGGQAAPGSAPRGPARSAPRAPREPLPGTGIYRSGTVLKVMGDRGFGFLRGDDEQDYFFDEVALEPGEFRRLAPGTSVTFEVVHAPRGLRAQSITID